jgi:hypothetical protein
MSLQPAPILSQISPLHVLSTDYFKTCFNYQRNAQFPYYIKYVLHYVRSQPVHCTATYREWRYQML